MNTLRLTLVGPLVLTTVATCAAQVRSVNFIGPDEEIVQAAEVARLRSARFWTGSPLPGHWSTPCRILVRPLSGTSTGRTRFTIANGEVFDWRMEASGGRAAILSDVIPHEVDHMVRASLCRRALPRWLDEGCAALFESPASHAQLRTRAHRAAGLPHWTAWLDSMAYPVAAEDQAMLYAGGFSLVEFLLEQHGPRRLLALQIASDDISTAFAQQYGYSFDELPTHWRAWLARRQNLPHDCSKGCLLHSELRSAITGAPVPPTGSRLLASDGMSTDVLDTAPAAVITPGASTQPVLDLWTAAWCPPCHLLTTDFRENRWLREQLLARYQLHWRDIDREPQAAQAAGVTSVPVFQSRNLIIRGYLGPEWLIRQLDAAASVAPPGTLPPTSRLHTPEASEPAAPAVPATLAQDAPRAPGPTPGSAPNSSASANRPVVHPPAIPSVTAGAGGARAPVATATPTGRSTHPSSATPASRGGGLRGTLREFMPAALTGLQLLGIVTGTAATGGIGGMLLAVAFGLLRRRATRSALSESPVHTTTTEEAADMVRAPFPRELDEASELLEIRQSEGRVAALDALRGMFVDDELEKLSVNPAAQQFVHTLRANLQTRIDEVAPLSTKS